MKFEVEGKMRIDGKWQKFKKEIMAHNERFATEKIYSIIGSNHKLKRNLIKIESIREVKE